MLKYPFNAKPISTTLFFHMQKKSQVWKRSFTARAASSNTTLLFFPHFPHTTPSFATKVWLQVAWKKKNLLFYNCIFSQNRKMLLLAIMPSWQIYNQGVTQGRKATRKHTSLALEVHLLITNTEFAKNPYYYLSHTAQVVTWPKKS